ncbi:hypothetical protein Hanom_Chr16g01461261 [Helianthus anomalus]
MLHNCISDHRNCVRKQRNCAAGDRKAMIETPGSCSTVYYTSSKSRHECSTTGLGRYFAVNPKKSTNTTSIKLAVSYLFSKYL